MEILASLVKLEWAETFIDGVEQRIAWRFLILSIFELSYHDLAVKLFGHRLYISIFK